jgi:hypothetical protein
MVAKASVHSHACLLVTRPLMIRREESTREAATPKTWRLVADPPTLPNVLIFSAAMGAAQWQTSRLTHPVRLRRSQVI